MVDEEVCILCDDFLSSGEVEEVKQKGVVRIVQSSKRRNDGKEVLLSGRDSVKVHVKCRKKYTVEKSVAVAERKAARPDPAPINNPADLIPERPQNDFSYGDHCLFCGDEFTAEFKEKEKKKPVDRRVVIRTVKSEHTKQSIMEAIRKYPDDWSAQVRIHLQLSSDDTYVASLVMLKLFMVLI